MLALLSLAGGSLRGQSVTREEAAAFDRVDRESRELISVIQCARRAAEARMSGTFGPIDSLGTTHLCIRAGGRWLAVFADVDTSFSSATNLSAVDAGTRARFNSALDTAEVLALARAEQSAQRAGAQAYRAANRFYVPLSMRFDGDTIEAWLLPASLVMGGKRTVGGERGYVFTPDGKQLLREIDSFSDYRPLELPDSGEIRIPSSQVELPTLSELMVANILNSNGRRVTVVTRRMTSSLVSSSAGDVWIHLLNK